MHTGAGRDHPAGQFFAHVDDDRPGRQFLAALALGAHTLGHSERAALDLLEIGPRLGQIRLGADQVSLQLRQPRLVAGGGRGAVARAHTSRIHRVVES